jgi:hypothetical protein
MRNTHPQLSVTSSVAASRPETLLWPVESHYEIRVINRLPVILPAKDSKFERTYDPMLEARLCEQFSSVYDQRTLLKFVSYYGLLGVSHLVQPEKRVGGDPVPWALAHARRVRAAFRIVSLLKEAPASRIKKLPASLPGILKDTDIDLVDMRTWFGTMAGGGHRQVRKLWSTSSWPSDPLGTAWEIVRRFINPGIDLLAAHFRAGQYTTSSLRGLPSNVSCEPS